MQNAECEQIKTVDNCFYRSECAETRSNGSRVYRGEQYDYVSRERMQNVESENSLPLEGKVLNESEADEVEIPENNDDNTSSVTEGDSFPSRGSLGESEENEI